MGIYPDAFSATFPPALKMAGLDRPAPNPLQPLYPDDPIQAGIMRIGDAIALKETAGNIIRDASEEQQQEWLSWVQSLVTNIPGRQFSDYFPPEAIARYCDRNGNGLPGYEACYKNNTDPELWQYLISGEQERGCLLNGNPSVYWLYKPDNSQPTVAEQENYLRLSILPAVATNLLFAFQNGHRVLHDENPRLKQQIYSVDQENRELKQQLDTLKQEKQQLAQSLEAARAELLEARHKLLKLEEYYLST